MKTISYKLKDLDQKEKKVTLKLGYVGENEHVQIRIDCSEIWENYPNAVASLAVEPPEGSKYPAIVTREGNVVCWTVKDSDLVHDGDGRIQLTFTEGSEIQKTVICRTKVDESIVGSGTAPDPIADFVAEANEALAELEAAEVHGPVIGEDGYWYTWSKDAGEYVKTDTKAQGEDGQQGPAGKDGADGAPGQDGHTPVKGTDYWTQQDQADIVAAAALETVSAVIDDTAGDGDTNKTWSADKIAETTGQLLTAIQGKPDMKNTDAESGVFDITDGNGYVVLRLKNGHIETKGFDSEKSPAIKATDSDIGTFDLSDGNGNVILRLVGGHIQTKHFNSAVEPKPIEYKFSGSDLLLAYKYTSTHDAVVVLNVGRANDLFDFSKFCLKDKGTSLENLETADLTTVWTSGTDMHSPFQFNVTTDADGYYSSSTDPSFTGGNHKVEINGSNIKSASSKYVYFFADGEPVTTGYGLCNHFTMKWANEVQAYNCVKADGTGRTSLIEYHEMIFDGVRFNEEIMLVPKEEISMRLWYGLQSVSWKSTYTKARFIDGTNRNEFTDEDNSIASGNAKTSGVIETGTNHSMMMTVDICCDLGERPYYTGTSGAFIVSYGTSGKGYFNIINQSVTMGEGDAYILRGSYRFYPTVA